MRYLLFDGYISEDSYGVHDFVGAYDTIEEALAVLPKNKTGRWAQIFDLTEFSYADVFWSDKEKRWAVDNEWLAKPRRTAPAR